MTTREELDLILKLIRKYDLPLSPILEYAINEKCEILESCSLEQEESTEEGVIDNIREQLQSIVIGYNSSLSLLVDFDLVNGLVIRKQRNETNVEESTEQYNDDLDVIFTHPLDWSPFEYGFTIEQKFHEAIFEAVDHYIQRGTGINITLLFKGCQYDAKITNANRQVKGDTIRLLYRGKKNHLGMRLAKEFPEVYNYIKQFKEARGGRAQCKLPLDLLHTIKMYKTDKNDVYRIEIV